MGLEALLAKLTARADTSFNPLEVSGKPIKIAACTLDAPDTPEMINGEVEVDSAADYAADRNKSLAASMEDRRTCSQYLNLRERVCTIAKPEHGALVVANRGYRPDPLRQFRCVGYAPLANDPNQRTGSERWPGLMQIGGE
jgi:hypothetical protein